MAEGVVDGSPMSRFFCHKCSIEIERSLPDYTCPRCSSGFIEELERESNDSSSEMNNDGDTDLRLPYRQARPRGANLLNFGNQLHTTSTSNRNIGPLSRRRIQSLRNHQDAQRSNNGAARQEPLPMSLDNFIQEFILNLSEVGVGHPVTQAGQLPVLFLGNPGDYVWGQDGFDAIVTQLLNQWDGTGPPPLPRKQIDEIPTTIVNQNHIDTKLQCSVCWEDFQLSESVKQLPCQHIYHAPCIVPWLELHGTCPICRQHLGDQSSTEVNQDTVGRSFVALFRAANEATNTGSSSSSSGENSSTDSFSEISD